MLVVTQTLPVQIWLDKQVFKCYVLAALGKDDLNNQSVIDF